MNNKGYIDWDFIILLAIIFLVFPSIICGIVYFGSCKEADVLNKSLGTNYTCSDMFWAKDTISNITEGKKYRIKMED